MPYKNKAKQNEYQRRWISRRREEFFVGKKCEDCGSENELNLHHVDPQEKLTHSIWSWSEKRRNAEIAKCKVLCLDCHKKVHAAKHGTPHKYERNGCRCDLCRKAHTDYQREWRKTRGM